MEFSTFWNMTINNPTENDYVLVRNPNEKYIRQLVWTNEVGECGTPHIQAWIRLQRNNRLAFMKKLYPRGHFRYITKDEYNENSQQYAQKEDDTTAGVHTISLNEPLPAIDTTLYKVLERAAEIGLTNFTSWRQWKPKDVREFTERAELEILTKRNGFEKIFISPTYRKMKQEYWQVILMRQEAAAEEEQEVSVPMTNADDNEGTQGGLQEASGTEAQEGEGYEDGDSEADEDDSTGSGDCSGEESDGSEDGEQTDSSTDY